MTSAKNESALRLLVASVIGLAALYTLVLRLIVAWGLPLWIDESWTAVLSSAHSFSDWRHQAWLDSNAPLYYFFIWLWPFESDFGLKLPSLLFLIGSAALAALWRTDSLTRDQRFFWGALIFLWAPGMSLFVDARYYGLLFLLSVAQTVAFLRLVERPSLARASLWTGLSTLAVLSHYYAAIPATAQGLLLLLHLRKKAFQLWPAALLTVPAFAELAWHWPRIRLYAEHSWYSAIPPGEIPVYVSWPITPNVAIAAAVLVVAFVFRRSVSTPVKLVAGASLASLAVMIAMGVAFPMLTYRYLIPVVPGILLALAVFVRPVAWPPIVALLCLALPGAQAQTKRLEKRAWFGLEVPVREVPQSARTVSWFMNYDGAQVLDPEQMKRLIADAFARNGRQVEPRWGLVDSDATIILDEKNYRRRGCKILDQGRASILICPRMRQTYVSE